MRIKNYLFYLIKLLALSTTCFPFLCVAQVDSAAKNQEDSMVSLVDFKPVKAAIIVRNRAGSELNSKQRTLEDLVAGEITALGVRVISREDVLESIGTYERGRSAASRAVDQLFMDNTSALQLAQNLGADYLLTASILSLDSKEHSFSGYGVESDIVETSLRLHYRIVGRIDGGSLIADNLQVSHRERQQPKSRIPWFGRSHEDSFLTNFLLQEAASKMAKSLKEQLRDLPDVAQEVLPYVNVTIHATMQDLSVPDIVRNEAGDYVVTANRYQLDVFGANVEVNGLTIGSTSKDTPSQVPPGINRLRISRPGYKDVTRTVNFFEGQYLLIPMQMSEAGLGRMREMTEILQGIKAEAKLTDAEVSKMEGYAQFLRQSGTRIDYRTDTSEQIQVNQTANSLFGEMPSPAR